MGKFTTNTFLKGMVQDKDNSVIGKDEYRRAVNFRLTSDASSTTASLENIVGNTILTSTLLTSGGYKVCGHCSIREYLYIFATQNDVVADNKRSKILEFKLDSSNPDNPIIESSDTIFMDTVGNSLHFSMANPVKAVGVYESIEIQKLYFVDGYNPFRFINVSQDHTATYIDELTVLPVYPNNGEFKLLDVLNSGDLRAGKIQYAYQFYNLYGAETAYSPPSALYAITDSSYTDDNDSDFKGDDVDVVCNKSLKMLLQIVDVALSSKFDKIRIVALEYTTLTDLPTVRIVQDINTISDATDYIFIDNGNSLGEYSPEEITLLSTTLFSAIDITTKQNRLYVTNISEFQFEGDDESLDFDSRSYRFNKLKLCKLLHNNGDYIIINASVGDPSLYTNWVVTRYDSFDTLSDTYDSVLHIPKDFDCINPYNKSLTDEWAKINPTSGTDSSGAYIYKSDGITYGASGPYVGFRLYFDNHANGPLILNEKTQFLYDSTEADFYNENTNEYEVSTKSKYSHNSSGSTYANYANPTEDATRAGYMQDEVYRFAVVYGDNKGRTGFANWSCDIRMPKRAWVDVDDSFKAGHRGTSISYHELQDASFNIAKSAARLYARPLRCEMHVNASSIAGKAEYWQAVYVNRTNDHKSVVAAGYISFPSMVALSDDTQALASQLLPSPGTYEYGTVLSSVPSIDDVPAIIGKFKHNNIFVSPDLFINKPEYQYNSMYYDITHYNKQPILYNYSGLGYKDTNKAKYLVLADSGKWLTKLNTGDYKIKNTTKPTIGTLELPVKIPITTGRTIAWGNTISDERISIDGTPLSLKVVNYRTHKLKPDHDDSVNIGGSILYTVSADEAPNLPNLKFVWHGHNDLYSQYDHHNSNTKKYYDGFKDGTSDNTLNSSDAGIYYGYLKRDITTFDTSQYGGNTYYNRLLNEYISCGETHSTSDSVFDTMQGDTFICMYNNAFTIWSADAVGKFKAGTTLAMPVETTYNLNYSLEKPFTKHINGNVLFNDYNYITNHAYKIHEISGKFEVGTVSGLLTFWEQKYGLYDFNPAYNVKNKTKSYFPKSDTFITRSKYDCQVRASDIKYNEELSDSWLKFRTNVSLEVNTQYGQIYNILNFKDNLFYWQDHAVGVISTNDRSVIQDTNGSALVLGDSGILDRFQYLSTNVGNTNRRGVIPSNNAIYWIDNKNKDISILLGQQVLSLSKQKLIQSFVNKLNNITDVIGVFDSKFDEILLTISFDKTNLFNGVITNHFSGIGYNYVTIDITSYNQKLLENLDDIAFTMTSTVNPSISVNKYIKRKAAFTSADVDDNVATLVGHTLYVSGTEFNASAGSGVNFFPDGTIVSPTEGKFTLVFSEPVQAFTSFYTFTPNVYVNHVNNYLSFDYNYTNNMYIHNYGQYGNFYNNTYTSNITLTSNPEYTSTKALDNILYFSSSFDAAGTNYLYDTFNYIRAYTDYQNSDYRLLDPNMYGEQSDTLAVRRKERGFTTYIPRNKVNKSLTTNANIFNSANISDDLRLFCERIRDRYVNLNLIYSNEHNFKFNIPYITTNYRNSIR
jgi:hypothetical protein